MKLHTTKSLIATAILGALFLHSSDTFAVQPKLKQSDITIPLATDANQLATKRCYDTFTLNHIIVNSSLMTPFSEKIFDRYIKKFRLQPLTPF